MFVKSYITLLAALLVATACRDAEAATAPPSVGALDVSIPARALAMPDTGLTVVTSATAPDGYASWLETELDLTPDAGWIGQTAYGQSVIKYYATDVTGDVDLRTLYGTTAGPSSSGHEARGTVYPSYSSLTAGTSVMVPKSCGYIVNVVASGSVWMKVVTNKLLVKWSEKSTSAPAHSAQPSCSTTSSGGSNGPGSTGGTGGTYAGGYGDLGSWTELCSVTETTYVDASGSHTIDTTTCRTVFVSFT